MPSPEAKLVLKSWDDFVPQERANDHEFNLLLFKFKSLCNEVRDYQDLHSDCSVTKSSNAERTEVGPNNINNTSVTINDEQNASSSSNGGQSMISMRRKFFQQQQDLGLPPLPRDISNISSRLKGTNTIAAHQPKPYHENNGSSITKRISQHYNSSHNLTSSASVDINGSQITRPEIKQRHSQHSSSRLASLSKSSERLDTINNNHITIAASISSGPRDRPTPPLERQKLIAGLSKISPILARNLRDLRDDDTIYDAVSPDDLGEMPIPDERLPSAPPLPTQAHGNKLDSYSDSDNNNSSLSLVPNSSFKDQEYSNYVNIDFFLKRSQSPSFDDGLEEDSSEDHDDEFNCFLPPQYQQSNSNNSQRDINNGSMSLTALRDSNGSRASLIDSHPLSKPLSMIRENQLHHQPMHKTQTIPHRQATISRDSNQHLGRLLNEHSICDGSNSSALAEAHTIMRSFLSDLYLSPVDDVFEDKAQRRIVKESFAVEFCGRRKLRHLFLFNDVIVCAKYQASSKQKFTFDVKWYLNLDGVTISDVYDASNQIKLDIEAIENQILAIRTNLMLLRGRMQQIKRSKDKKPSKIIKKLKKKRTELEAELVLLLPHLPLVIKHVNGKKYLFFLSSNFDRNQWIESIKYLQSQIPSTKSGLSSPSSSELQAWIQTCRKNLNPSLGTFLLRSNCDDDLLYGDLYINLDTIKGIPKAGHYYFCFEVDSYGHFSQKASSVVLRIDDTTSHQLNDEYVFPLDGAHTLRILFYEDQGQNSKPSVVGKAQVELSRAWCLEKPVERHIEFNSNCSLSVHLSYSNSELLSMRIPHAKLCPAFGLDITQVCKKEKTQIPLLIQLCVHEVERRGMKEVGIYRMSGTSTDIQRLKKAFDTNPYIAELLLRDIDINSVTGFLKTYLREMPEGLFINKLYPKFVAAFNLPQSESLERTRKMLELFRKIPITNQNTISYMVDHLVKVNKYENFNKMSLTNLATVLGPNILRPPTNSPNTTDTSDPFTAVVIGSMSQAGILYFFLNRKAIDLPLTELDQSELSGTSEA